MQPCLYSLYLKAEALEKNLSVLCLTGTALLVLSLPEGSSAVNEPVCTLYNRDSPACTLYLGAAALEMNLAVLCLTGTALL